MKEGNSYFLKDEYEGIVAFSIKEVARMLQLPPSTISLYCKEGLLPCFKVGRHYRIAKTDLIRFIDEAKDECITNKHLPPPQPLSNKDQQTQSGQAFLCCWSFLVTLGNLK